MLKDNKIVGVVIPVYNCEKYLIECLESVVNQSYYYLKIILINDGSTDRSLEILKKYAIRDDRIIVVDQINSGQGVARNVGMDLFKNKIKLQFYRNEQNLSVFNVNNQNNYNIKYIYIKQNQSSRQFNLSIDYIIFLDSDDFWELNCIEECIKHMSNVDIVWFDYKLHYDLEYKYAVTLFDLYKFQKDMIISSEKWLKLSFKNEISEFWFTWQGMINFKKLDDLNIYFKKGILYEDQVFGILLFGQVNSIYVLVKTLLNYRIRLNSSMNYDRETKQYSSYFNGLSKTNINNIKKSFEYDINITNKYLQIARICNTYLTINKIIQNKNIFHLFKQVFLNKYLERSVQIFNFKEDPLGIKHTLAGEIDKEIDNFFILPPQDKLSHIPIVFSCDSNYFSYLTVVLQSIKEKSSENYNYDIYILHNKLDKSLTQKLINYIQAENFSIKFVDISRILNLLKSQIQFYTALFFSEATYYRFFIPKIFKEFKKIIYLDTDIIVKQDLNLLYSIDFDKPLAAAKCMIFSQVKQADHRITKLKMKQPENYFQAGVMVYNIQKCLKMDFTQKCLNKLQELKDPPLVDQDVLNAVFEGDIHYISLKWNCLWNVSYRIPNFKILYSKDFLKDYQEAERDPYIIHYCDYFKPWNSPHLPKADIWWHYARQTPFYEEILFKNITQNSLNIIQNSIQGAVERVKAHLSYKLGKEILSVKENKLKVLILPFALILIYVKHKISNLIFKLILISNPNLKSLPLNHYSDYQEALKIQNYLSYKLGNLLIKYPFTFVFRVASVYKEWKKNR